MPYGCRGSTVRNTVNLLSLVLLYRFELGYGGT